MNGLMEFSMPYMIQFLREYTSKVDLLVSERKDAQQAEMSDEAAKKQQEAQSNAYLSLMPLALPAPPVAGDAGFGGGAGYGAPTANGYGAPPGFGQPSGFGAPGYASGF